MKEGKSRPEIFIPAAANDREREGGHITVLSQFFGDRRKAQHHEASCLQVLVHCSFGVCCRVQEEVPRQDLYIAAANA
jgi:hypothetical protein